MNCTAPSLKGSSGAVLLSATTPDGSSASSSQILKYKARPEIASLAPNTGRIDGGMILSLRGSGFDQETTVSVNGQACKDLNEAGSKN